MSVARHVTDQPLLPRILAALQQPRTLEGLAAHLQVTDARLAWHLRHLAGLDYVVLDTESSEWRRTDVGATVSEDVVVVPSGPLLPRVVSDFHQAFAEAQLGLFGSDFTQSGGEHRTRLSAEQAAEFTQRLTDLVAEYFAPGRGDRNGIKYGLCWTMTPIDLHPLTDPEDYSKVGQ